jgi:hypothetical protein
MSNYIHRRRQVGVFVFHVHGMAEGSVSSVVVPLRLLSRVSPKSKKATQPSLRKHVTKARCWTGGTHRWTRLISSNSLFLFKNS